MSGLKLGRIVEERPVKLTIDLPAPVHRDLIAYGEALAHETGEPKPIEPAKLVAPMLARFMATDRGFKKGRQAQGG